MIETIYLAIIAALPAISSIIGIIAAVVKIARDGKQTNKDLSDKFEVLAAELHDSKEMDEMKTQMIDVSTLMASKFVALSIDEAKQNEIMRFNAKY